MGLPTWRIQIVKELGNEVWSNDYLTDDVTIEDAQDLSALLQTWERNIHMDSVLFSYIRVSSYAPDDRIFRHLTTNVPGLVTATAYLPLFNTLRVDLGTTDSDPARKYYRCPVSESTQTSGVFDGAYRTTIAGLITTYLITPGVLGHLVTTKGNTVVTATPYIYVQMRQLHRRRKKKVVTP